MALNHSVKGSVDYTIVGTPTIVDGVASNFSSSDYVRIDNTIPSTVPDLDISIRVKATTTASSGFQGIVSFGNIQQVRAEINKNNSLRFRYYDTSTSANVYDSASGLSLDDNTWYDLRFVYESSLGKLTITFSSDNVILAQKVYTSVGITEGAMYLGQTASGVLNGFIDLNNTYIKRGGTAFFGVCPVEVKHINYGTSVGYTKVGSPTITNGVASGFAGYPNTPAYVKTDNTVSLDQPFKISVKFTTSDSFLSKCIISRNSNATGGVAVMLAGQSSVNIRLYNNNYTKVFDQNVNTDSDFEANTTYELLIVFNGSSYDFSIKKTVDSQIIFHYEYSTVVEMGNCGASFGVFLSDTAYTPFNGSIDLNNTYIKVNGKLWFFRPCVNYQVHNDKLVFADSGLYLSGPVTYAVVGSPTITDNIITQANASNYVNITSADIPYTQYWEFVTYVQIGTRSSYGINNANNANGKARWQIGRNGTRLRFIAAYDNGWAIDITGPTNFSSGDWIYIKLNFTTTTRAFTLYSSVDGVNWTNEGTASSQVYEDGTGNILRLMNDASSEPVFLSMDLNKTYIKTDESLWFYGKNYASKNIAPVPSGYLFGDSQVACTAVGTPTITDGVVSGFSSSNYLQTSSSIDVTKPFEIFLKIKTAASSSSLENITQLKGTNSVIAINATSRKPAFLMRYYGTDSLLHSSTASFQSGFANNAIYYLKCICDTNGTSISVSTDKTNWETLTKPLPDDFVSWQTPTAFLLGSSTNNPFLGSIDLNETYVKVNNEMWFDGAKSATGVGWFDMRTQTFTAAPSGAVIGRDE